MESVPSKDLERPVQAVDDPFQFPDLPLQDGKPVDSPGYDPMSVMAILIEFASSNLWWNHLRRSNFTSFEAMISTRDGKRTALGHMLKIAVHLPEFLSTATKIVMAVRHLEELRCLNTAEIVIMWAWTIGVINPVDRDFWQLIGRDTVRFCQTHGMEHLIALKQQVTDRTTVSGNFLYCIGQRLRKSGPGGFVGSVLEPEPDITSMWLTNVYLPQTCQLRRLYQLFWYGPMTWKQAVGVEEVDEEVDVLLGPRVALAQFIDWAILSKFFLMPLASGIHVIPRSPV